MSNTGEFIINKVFIENNKQKHCLVCDKLFKENDKIVLVPIQQPEHGFANVVSIPIHKNCYWIKKEIPK